MEFYVSFVELETLLALIGDAFIVAGIHHIFIDFEILSVEQPRTQGFYFRQLCSLSLDIHRVPKDNMLGTSLSV